MLANDRSIGMLTVRRGAAAALLSAFIGVVGLPGAAQSQTLHRVAGTVSIDQGQAGFIVTAGYGGGLLRFKGKSYRFKVAGLGVGGVGISSLRARGTVYDMTRVTQFPGSYFALRSGAVVGTRSVGRMWLKNSNGVLIELSVQRKGLMLSTGADGVVISM